MEVVKFIDLFAGIGGFRLGLEMAGFECVGFVEKDKFARASYEAIHDTEGEWTAHDIKDITNNDIERFKGNIDIITGGFPCQAFSVAGKRGGFNDTRGTLFFEIARLAEQIKPRLLLLENVKGLLSHDKGKTFATILNTLDELGYDAEWQVLNSKDFGVPQNRERTFIVGHLRNGSRREIFPIRGTDGPAGVSILAHRKGYRRNTQVFSPEGITEALDTGQGGGRGHYTVVQPVLTPDRVVKRQNGRRFKENGEPMFTITSQDRHGVMVVGNTSKTNHGGADVHDVQGLSPTLKARDYKGPVQIAIREATKKGYAEASPGDSVNMAVPTSKTRRGRVGDGIANTLDTGSQQGVVTEDVRIRKLTPRECWRLQGFPDWAFDKAQAVNSDSQLYKQAGNAVTVNVIHAIAEQLMAVFTGITQEGEA